MPDDEYTIWTGTKAVSTSGCLDIAAALYFLACAAFLMAPVAVAVWLWWNF